MSDDVSEVRVSGTRELLVLRAGGRDFAVYADEAEGVTAWVEPAPLPHAPAAVLGVVSVRGRVRTVLDPAALHGPRGAAGDAPEEFRFLVSLRGDEQLALAATHAERVTAPADELPGGRDGSALTLLDPARLFDAAMQGAERRRRRVK